MIASDQLKIRIRDVFGEVPFPEHCGYSAAIAQDGWISDPEELERITAEKDKRCSWWEITQEDVPNLGLALSYFDARATKFYLPVCLTSAIGSSVYKNYCTLLDWMTPFENEPDAPLYEHFVERMSALTNEQKEVCRACLKYLRKNLDPKDFSSSDRIDELLCHDYWKAMH